MFADWRVRRLAPPAIPKAGELGASMRASATDAHPNARVSRTVSIFGGSF
jgi:hypothetical protein